VLRGTVAGMAIEVRAVDPHDDEALAARRSVSAAALAYNVPDLPAPCPVRYAGELRYQAKADLRLSWLGYLDGVPAGVLTMGLPQLDNTGNAEVELQVVPGYRRRGVGTALYRHALDMARRHGRVRIIGIGAAELPGGVPRPGDGAGFAAAMGAKEALAEVRRRLDLSTVDIPPAPAPAPGYSLVFWRGRSPDEYLADIGRLDGRMVLDAPMGDLVVEAVTPDADRIRDYEEAQIRRGTRAYHAGARHDATGTLVAWTTVGFESTVPDHAWQWITIVDPAHRGHRLGRCVKLANLHHALATEPALRTIDTWNAASNAHMIAINEEMGFRAVDAWIQWQHEF
jgi:GNAT superfamily N-acetyltransferase